MSHVIEKKLGKCANIKNYNSNKSLADINSHRRFWVDKKIYLNLVEVMYWTLTETIIWYIYQGRIIGFELWPLLAKNFKKDISFERKVWADQSLKNNYDLKIYHYHVILAGRFEITCKSSIVPQNQCAFWHSNILILTRLIRN